MHDSLFADQKVLTYKDLTERAPKLGLDAVKFNQCVSSYKYADIIQNNLKEARTLGLSGTPTFFLGTIEPDGRVVKIEKAIEGAQPYETFKADLDELLAPKKTS